MLVSIVVLVYDRPMLTKQTLDTLLMTLQLTDVPYEVIVVDNESGPETKALLETYENIRFIRLEKNKGIGGGKNVGIAAARGTHFYISDNDMYFLQGWLDELVAIYPHFPDVKILGAYGHHLHRVLDQLEHDGKRIQIRETLAGNSWYLSRDMWETYGPLLEGVGTGMDDVQFCNNVFTDGKEVANIWPHRVIHCGVHTSAGSLPPGSQKLRTTADLPMAMLPPGIVFG